MSLLDYFKIGWFYFARSRGWSAKVKLSTGMRMEGSTKTFTVQSPLYKFEEPTNYKLREDNKDEVTLA